MCQNLYNLTLHLAFQIKRTIIDSLLVFDYSIGVISDCPPYNFNILKLVVNLKIRFVYNVKIGYYISGFVYALLKSSFIRSQLPNFLTNQFEFSGLYMRSFVRTLRIHFLRGKRSFIITGFNSLPRPHEYFYKEFCPHSQVGEFLLVVIVGDYHY